MAKRSKGGIAMDLRIDPQQVAEAKQRLRSLKGGVARAVVAALNKTAPGVRTEAVRFVTQAYTVKAASARESLTVKKATANYWEASVTSRGSVIPLAEFQVSPRRVGGVRPKGGLKVVVRRGAGGRLNKGFAVPNMNLGGAFGRRLGVGERLGRTRLPIRPLYGPSVPTMLTQEHLLTPLQENASERLRKAMAHEIDRIEAGYGK